jgi:hypothetical protein
MLDISKNKYLHNIKIKFILVYILNCSDFVTTKVLLNTGAFYEGNILMRNIITDNLLSVLIKLLLPCFLFLIIYLRMRAASDKQLKYSAIAINVCLIYYILINLTHLIWILFFYNKTFN